MMRKSDEEENEAKWRIHTVASPHPQQKLLMPYSDSHSHFSVLPLLLTETQSKSIHPVSHCPNLTISILTLTYETTGFLPTLSLFTSHVLWSGKQMTSTKMTILKYWILCYLLTNGVLCSSMAPLLGLHTI